MAQPSTTSDTWIRRYHRAPGSGVRLLCLPHAGGSASFFFPASAELAPAIEVCAVQYPGRQDRRAEPSIDSIADLADAITEAVRPLADRPLALFGHSMGAILAYEVALRLEGDGPAPPVRLFVSGRRAPSRYRPSALHTQDDQSIIDELRRLSGTRSDLLGDPETREMILPAVRNDYRAVETYRDLPGRTLRCPVVACVGDRDSQVTLDEAKAWADHTTGTFDLRVFSGGHFYLTDAAQGVVEMLAEELSPFTDPPAV